MNKDHFAKIKKSHRGLCTKTHTYIYFGVPNNREGWEFFPYIFIHVINRWVGITGEVGKIIKKNILRELLFNSKLN